MLESILPLSSECELPCLHFSWFCCSLFAALHADSMCPHSFLTLHPVIVMDHLGTLSVDNSRIPSWSLRNVLGSGPGELWDGHSCFHFALRDEHLEYMVRMSLEVSQWLGMSAVINESMNCTCNTVDYVTPGLNGWCLEGAQAVPPAVTTSTWLSYTLCYTYPTSPTWKSSYLPPPFATGFTCAPVLKGSGHLCWPENSHIGVSVDGWLRYTF